jgi:hypothetical protein
MEWNVKNAVNRDVERQHLNKILREIESRVVSIGAPPSTQEVTRIVERVIRDASPDALTSVKVTLTGDVSGEGSTNALGNISIDVGIDPSLLGISEAPIDSQYYWRINGTWEQVSSAVSGLQNVDTLGIMVHMGGEVGYVTRDIEGEVGEIVVTYGDGLEGNPLIGLEDVTPELGGTMKVVTFDDKGRRIEEDEADTDDLPEGVTNLYFTDERAQDAIGSILESSEHITLFYDDDEPSIYAEITNVNLETIANVVASDGDIMEWQGIDNEWEVTKSPRLLHLDGGNF